MWPFTTRRTLQDIRFFENFTEVHCHLLPGVDDGIKNIEDTLRALELYEKAGVSEIWFTPHIMEDVPNHPEQLRTRFEEVCQVYQGPICLHLAAENMLDALFCERLETRNLLPLGKEGNRLLIETSYFNPPFGLDHLIDQVKSAGYFPVLAHPERYIYMDDEDYQKLKDKQVLFQLNLPSIAGMYGKAAEKKAQKLLKKGWYDLCGTDTHRVHQFNYLANEARIDTRILKRLTECFK